LYYYAARFSGIASIIFLLLTRTWLLYVGSNGWRNYTKHETTGTKLLDWQQNYNYKGRSGIAACLIKELGTLHIAGI